MIVFQYYLRKQYCSSAVTNNWVLHFISRQDFYLYIFVVIEQEQGDRSGELPLPQRRAVEHAGRQELAL